MPAVNQPGGSNGSQRTTFPPPWVKQGPEPLPMPTAPWIRSRRQSQQAAEETQPVGNAEKAPVRKQSTIKIIPSQPSIDKQQNGTALSAKEQLEGDLRQAKEKLQHVKAPEKPPLAKEKDTEVLKETKTESPPQTKEKKIDVVKEKAPTKAQTIPLQRKLSRDGNSIPKPPAPPMPPPPPPPAIPGYVPPTAEKKAKIDALKNRPRKRPDWGVMMKEIEQGSKLKHVQCNDRSSPILPKVKVKQAGKEQFLYESEKANVHNLLLKQINEGVKLKRVQCNDRSKPQLDGLRKFRRQLTIEEQIQKAEIEDEAIEPDELDDIDKVRDDLQSSKQMLALELRNKEAVERENKRLLARLLNLEAELEKERSMKNMETKPTAQKNDEEQIVKFRNEMSNAQQHASEMESKYHDVAGQLDMTKVELEELLRKNKALERKLSEALTSGIVLDQQIIKQPSSKRLNKESSKANIAKENSKANLSKQETKDEESEETEEEEEETETEESSEEENNEEMQEKRQARELKMLLTKLRAFKDKEVIARNERRALREQMKKEQKALKQEKKKYKMLQKEVDKIAKLMKDDDDEAEENEEKAESEESESESEESSSSEDEESDGDLPPERSAEDKRKNLVERAKRHENCLSALKKGNYLLKANLDRLKDNLFQQREMSITLQEDLNSVLAELG